jgi:hypothetical protein
MSMFLDALVVSLLAFIVVVAMRLASLRWGLETPMPADLGQKLTPGRHQGDQQAPQGSTEDKPQ